MKWFVLSILVLSSSSAFARGSDCDADLVKAKLRIISEKIQATYKESDRLEEAFEARTYSSRDLLTLSLRNLSERRLQLREERMSLIINCQ